MGSSRISPRPLFIFALALLSLVAVDTALAQGEGTTNQDPQSKGVPDVQANVKPSTGNIRGTLDSWAPADVDTLLPLPADASCSLPDVISGAGDRVKELINNLDRYSATEVIRHQPVNRSGKMQNPEIQKSNYVYTMKERPDGYIISEEDRDMSRYPNGFPDQVATLGSPGLVLIFLPTYLRSFHMSCEGSADWHGQAAWQIRFEEQPDQLPRMSNIAMDGKVYEVRLRGIAWILKDSYQVVHLEVDLAETIPKIRLRLEHQIIEFLPVSFPESDTTIWLPSSAELYLDFRGHRFYRRLSYTNFKLFSVKVQQQVSNPR